MSIKKRGIPKALLSLAIGAADALGSRIGLPPLYLPLVGPEGSLAFMQLNDFETKEYFSKHPSVYQGGWQNKARAALVWELFAHKYSPIRYVPDLTCPIQFVAATEDVLCPVDQVLKAVRLAKQGVLLSRQCTHFELYRGKLFEGLVAEQVEFLRQQTGLAKAAVVDVAAPEGVSDAVGIHDQDR
jgi:pimeloyl-ACP methyl ester carboxylesterase